jgi:tetratricopeptide (TPR) repeat protein
VSTFFEARSLLSTGRYDQAIKLLLQWPDNSPQRLHLLGMAHLGRKDGKAALTALSKAAQADPDNLEIQFLLGRAHLLAAAPQSAIRILETLAKSSYEGPDLIEALASAYRQDARYEDAVQLIRNQPASTQQMLYEHAMCLARLGNVDECLATWDTLIKLAPDLAAAWFGSHSPALELLGWNEADRRLQKAITCPKANGKYQAMLAAYHMVSGRAPCSFNKKHAHIVDSVQAILPHLTTDTKLFGIAASLLRWAVGQAKHPGLVLEFGVRRGTSLKIISEVANQFVHGFDSFEGLPEAWIGSPQGVLSTGREMPEVADHIALHPGWFDQTVPAFLDLHDEPIRFANLDCDIYSSTKTVLDCLGDRIVPGTILVFDEFIGNRTWRTDEFQAFEEFVTYRKIAYRIIALNIACKQVAILIED